MIFKALVAFSTIAFVSGIFTTECDSFCLNLIVFEQPKNLTCPSQIVDCDVASSNNTHNNSSAIQWCLTLLGESFGSEGSICYSSSGDIIKQADSLGVSLVDFLLTMGVNRDGTLLVPIEIMRDIISINCSIKNQDSDDYLNSYNVARREFIYDVILPDNTPLLLRHPEPNEIPATGGTAAFCVYGKAANAQVTWKINESEINTTFAFPNSSLLVDMDEFCLENPLYLLAEERSCDCLMSEFKRLNIIFPLDEGAGVFSGDFAYSNNPESLKSIECSGVDNRFISVLVIKNASFLEPQEVAVKISNTVNSRYHTYHFNVKTEYLHIEDTITPLVGETAELSEGETKWFLCTHTTSVGESRSIQWTSQVQRELNYINLTGDKLVNAAITDQLCENMNGSVLVAGFPEEIVRSEQHDGAYVSVQQSLLVFCAAQSSMTGIYICSDDSIQVRQVDVCVGSCPTLPQQTKEFDVTATLILVISCVLVMLVCVMIGLSVITWKYRNEKSAPGWLHKKTHLNMKELGIE